MRRVVLFVFAFFAATSLFSQVEFKVSTDTVTFAEPFTLQIKIHAAQNSTIAFPELNQTLGSDVGLSKIQGDTTSSGDGMVTVTYELTLIPFADSVLVINPLNIRIDTASFHTDTIVLAVRPLPIDTAQVSQIDTTQAIRIFDVTIPLKAPLTLKEIWKRFGSYILAFLILAIVAGLLIWYYIRRKNNKPVLPVSEPQVPPHLEAFDALMQLKGKKYCSKGKFKELYSHLSFILRRYIERQFNIGALELTTSELKEILRYSGIFEQDLYKRLMSLFTNADMVKYAKYEPLQNVCDADLQFAFEFLDKTKPEEKLPEDHEEQEESEEGTNTEKQ